MRLRAWPSVKLLAPASSAPRRVPSSIVTALLPLSVLRLPVVVAPVAVSLPLGRAAVPWPEAAPWFGGGRVPVRGGGRGLRPGGRREGGGGAEQRQAKHRRAHDGVFPCVALRRAC